MEKKPPKQKNKILSFLPKAASFAFRNPSFSPSLDKKFSGPIKSIVPLEIRRNSKNGSFDSQEPTSPKVSCIGQIKRSKSKKKKNSKSKPVSPPRKFEKKKPKSPKGVKKIDESAEKSSPVAGNLPSLGQMKRFASNRDVLADFDWTSYDGSAAINRRSFYSDEEREESDEEDEVIIPFSAPLMVGGGRVASEPRKEVNLWKRRTMTPPRPLRLNNSGKP